MRPDRVKDTVRSWPMILLVFLVVPLLGLTLMTVPVMLAEATGYRWLAVVSAVTAAVAAAGCVALMVRALFLRVSARSGRLKVHGLLASAGIPADAVEAVTVEETWTGQGGFMRLPVVHYRDAAHGTRRMRLWMLARKSPFALEPTLAWLETVTGPRP